MEAGLLSPAGHTGKAAQGPGDPQGCVLHSAVTEQQDPCARGMEGPGFSVVLLLVYHCLTSGDTDTPGPGHGEPDLPSKTCRVGGVGGRGPGSPRGRKRTAGGVRLRCCFSCCEGSVLSSRTLLAGAGQPQTSLPRDCHTDTGRALSSARASACQPARCCLGPWARLSWGGPPTVLTHFLSVPLTSRVILTVLALEVLLWRPARASRASAGWKALPGEGLRHRTAAAGWAPAPQQESCVRCPARRPRPTPSRR